MKRYEKWTLCGVLALTLMITLACAAFSVQGAAAQSSEANISYRKNLAIYTGTVGVDIGNAGNGYVRILYDKPFTANIKVIVWKDDAYYTYTISQSITSLPLQMGDGKYRIALYENIEGGIYRTISDTTVSVEGLRDEVVYTNSIQMADYEGYADVIAGISALAADAENDRETAEITYNYIISNFSYSMDKAASVQGSIGYVPDLREFADAKAGICYDFASTFAAVLRSNGIPVKLVMGYRDGVDKYHAWNEVLLDGEWVTVDTSTDAQLKQAGRAVEMISDSSMFTVKKVY